MDKNQLSDEVRQIGVAKLHTVSQTEVKDEKEIIELGKYSVQEVKRRIRPTHSSTGTYIRKGYKKREGVEIIRKNFEVPEYNKTRFLKSLGLLCEQWEAQII